MAYDVAYPVDFRSGGDSVKAAFSKLIEEVNTIYGILNELAGDDFTDDQRARILASLTGSIAGSRITGSIDGSRITGNVGGSLDGSHLTGTVNAGIVSGELSLATIAAAKVSGLTPFVNRIIDGRATGSDEGSNLTENGYVKLANGLIVQWGSSNPTESVETWSAFDVTFPQVFPNACYSVMLTVLKSSVAAYLVRKQSVTGFRAATTASAADSTLYYLAIGV